MMMRLTCLLAVLLSAVHVEQIKETQPHPVAAFVIKHLQKHLDKHNGDLGAAVQSIFTVKKAQKTALRGSR